MLMSALKPLGELENATEFAARHIGPYLDDEQHMLSVIGAGLPNFTRRALIEAIVPRSIARTKPMALPAPLSEAQALAEMRALASKNVVLKSFIGQGYHGTHTPGVILRNILENPAWYTAYTPYQAEISQGRMEALVNFQTMVCDLTGMAIANASMLDEATAAAEAMTLAKRSVKSKSSTFVVAGDCHPQTIEVIQTRAAPLGLRVVLANSANEWDDLIAAGDYFAVLLQMPTTSGSIHDVREDAARIHAHHAAFIIAADLLALTLITPPGELGADIALGTTQRFGVPMAAGGPHAAYLACRDEYKRSLPGRLVGVSVDAHGAPAYRLALQTREQHIRREKATSNICTAQALLAIIASMYAVYHGPKGIRGIAEHVHELAGLLAAGLKKLGLKVTHEGFFDTVRVEFAPVAGFVIAQAEKRRINLRQLDASTICVSVDETTTEHDVEQILAAFAAGIGASQTLLGADLAAVRAIPPALARKSDYLTHAVFNTHHSETEMLRYLRLLESRDLSLTRSMIALGSCTMKLNATAEMMPITYAEFGGLHPFAPAAQAQGYAQIFHELSAMLREITGFAGVSLQPNAGAQGEYAGLLVIRAYHQSRDEGHRDVCLIPQSAHGTNPASAAMCGYKVVVVKNTESGDVDLADLDAKVALHGKHLAALMITYPSTYGVFEEDIKRICDTVHAQGGQIYMDGANMNAQVGLCRPGDFGADVCHLNLHKTFCIPHGGGGPGMGPICCAPHLAPFLPGHPVVKTGGAQAIGPVAAAPWGSASILLISWAYIKMMGAEGLTAATKYAILNANYMAHRLDASFPVVYRGKRGNVAHECIIDLRKVKRDAAIEVDDVAKRLIDYGFHAPTTSFPVVGTLMIEPTESESKAELDRFCDALISIRAEIREIEEGRGSKEKNVLKSAPHTAEVLVADAWDHPYTRAQAAFPAPWVKATKFWPSVGRLNHVAGDRNLVCSCPPIEEYAA